MNWQAAAFVTFLLIMLLLALKLAGTKVGDCELQQASPAVCAHPTVDTEWTVDEGTPIRPGTIFVSLPSYRDDECSETVYEMFENADNPDRIFAGVVQQNKYEKEDCFDRCPDCKKRKESGHIRVKNYDFKEARGPCFARYEASKLWAGEQYFMEIDSHTKFIKGWDTVVFEQLAATRDPRAVLAGYPPTEKQFLQIKRDGFKKFQFMCKVDFNKDGMPLATAEIIDAPRDLRPVPAAYAGANLMIMPYQALFDVPFDPHLNFLFFGEELLHSARLWTAGYNFYAPTKVFVAHHYERSGKPKFWDDLEDFEPCRKKAVQRVKAILGMPHDKLDQEYDLDMERYGLSNVRPIQDYWKLLGVDMDTKKTTNKCNLDGYTN